MTQLGSAEYTEHFGSYRNWQVAMARYMLYGETSLLPAEWSWDEMIYNYHLKDFTLAYAIGLLTEVLAKR